MAFHKVIGIDLGTTYSAVSVWDGKDTHVIESAFGARTIPSVVGLDSERNVIVGAPAQDRLVKDPENTIIEVKREMGTYERKPRGSGDPGVPRRIPFRGRDYLPQEISAFILMELKRQAEHYIGEPVHDAVITVPAYFKEPQRGATEDAARMARLNVRRLLNEPTAAAVCFGADKVEDDRTHTYAVYDLGGGTFDVSIIQVSPGNVSVVGTGGDPRLGGGDFDDRIVEHALQEIRAQYGVDLSGDRAIRQRIKREAEIRKRELSVANSTVLTLPYLTPTLSPDIRITRATFESLIRDLLDRSLDCLDEAIRSAHDSNGVAADEIEQVLLVGGSSRIACMRTMLAERLDLDPRDIRSDISPEEVVARGAGLVARDCVAADAYEGAEIVIPTDDADGERAAENVVLQDVTSHTLGVLANQGDFIPILAKESRLPAEVTDDNFINGERFTEVDVLIYQGERPVAIENDLIGRLPIKLPEARERGYYRFSVTFALDVHGLLNVAVKCLNDGQIWKTDLQCDLRAGREQIEQSARHLESVRAGDDDLPEPPRRAAPIEPPPDTVPDEYRRIASRAHELLGKLDAAERAELGAAYTAFVSAVTANSPDVDDLGDELTDVFYRVRPR
ncbi:Hsp70 family protein [Virgisporangium aurantiacum]|uniref:Chaperone protein DnaK n=1 Tax=Virgisporangium aurantiacum TaxID=175570 RepID=A0A8J4E3R0_9ACTN|nr:Hsp70 family protein [Virgisporangium aurantiacum]GIJ60309.1 chaperone protein DnaK [Virgisporangium aurantiacum]